MRITTTALPGVLVLEPKVFRDERGLFCETFNQRAFDAAVGLHVDFVQDNESHSGRHVLRGLHFQLPPHAQGKLVRVVRGRAFDVAVDIRKTSATFGRWIGIELTDQNHKQVWIPEGFAHGFLVTSECANFLYKTTAYYAPQFEGCLRWDDPALAIQWPLQGAAPILAPKDATAPTFAELFH